MTNETAVAKGRPEVMSKLGSPEFHGLLRAVMVVAGVDECTGKYFVVFGHRVPRSAESMEEYCGTEAMEVPILQVTEEYNALLAAATAAGCFPVWTFLPPCQRDLLRDPAANPSEDSLIALMDHSWLVGDDDTGLRADDSSRSWEPGREWSVGRYRDGSLLVHSTRDGGYDPMLLVYDDFRAMEAAAAKDGIPANVLAETATALGLELKDRNGI